jgi:hypothetical protein
MSGKGVPGLSLSFPSQSTASFSCESDLEREARSVRDSTLKQWSASWGGSGMHQTLTDSEDQREVGRVLRSSNSKLWPSAEGTPEDKIDRVARKDLVDYSPVAKVSRRGSAGKGTWCRDKVYGHHLHLLRILQRKFTVHLSENLV